MKRNAISIFVVTVIVLAVCIFMPTRLVKDANTAALQTVFYESGVNEKYNGASIVLNEDEKFALLTYLTSCRKYMTLNPVRNANNQPSTRKDSYEYLYISLYENDKYTDIHIKNGDCYVTIDSKSFRYHISNEKQVVADVQSLLWAHLSDTCI